MRTVTASLYFTCLWFTVTRSTVTTTTTSSLSDENCSMDVFNNCINIFTSLVNITSGAINTDALMKFYCSENFTVAINCIKDHLDPTCGPDTDAYIWNRTLTAMPADFSYDKYCKNDSANAIKKLLDCQTKFSKVQGYVDCITGETLNKTIDFADTCNFLKISTGCTYKYTRIMCPDFTQTFVQYSKDSLKKCDVDFENSEEATVCDKDMESACVAAYNPPSGTSNSSDFTNFLCSERSRGLLLCMRTVYGICINASYFNSSSVDRDIQIYETQRQTLCSNNSTAMTECQLKFSKLTPFQDCLSGKTLNISIDPSDTCPFIENSVACSLKYTDLICPEFLDTFNKSIEVPSMCDKNEEISKSATSCDADMGQACSAGFNPPSINDADVYLDFVCSGRAAGYSICTQKLQKLCYTDTRNVSDQSLETQTKVVCADKSGFRKYMQCLRTPSFKEEYSNCSSSDVTRNDTKSCSTLRCEFLSLENACSQSAKFHQKLHYQTLVSCNVVEATTIATSAQTTVSPFGGFLGIYVWIFAAAVCNNYIHMSV